MKQSRLAHPHLGDIFRIEAMAKVALALSLIITVVAPYMARQSVASRANDRFMFQVADAQQRISKRMLEYGQVLRGGVALFDTLDGEMSREAWRRYVAGLDIAANFPGIQGIGFARVLSPGELRAHEQGVRAQGFPGYRVHPEGEREIYSAIEYLEPFDERNQRAFGYDMLSEATRRAAMEQARDSGAAAVSGRVHLVQETDEDVQAGFLMYLPVYKPGLPTATVEQRRKALLGFVYSPFRTRDLMHGILGNDPLSLGFELFAGQSAEPATRLYQSPPVSATPDRRTSPAHVVHAHIDLPGMRWTARFYSRPEFDAATRSYLPLILVLGGVVVDLLILTIIQSLVGERRRIQAKAEAMTDELRASVERLRLAQDSAGIGIWDVDLSSGNTVWDRRMFELFGLPADGSVVPSDRWMKSIHPDDLERVLREFDEALLSGRHHSSSFRIVRGDGQVRTMEGQMVVVRDGAGNPSRLIGVTRDVTERAKAEEALRAQHALLQSIIDGIPDLLVLKDKELNYQAVNSTFVGFMGKAKAEILGKSDEALYPPAIAEQKREEDRLVLETGQCRVHEEQVETAGGPVWHQVVKVPLCEPDGGVKGVLTVARDVSSLKRSEQNLRRKHAELAAVFANSYVKIAVMDREFRFLHVNGAFAEYAGHPAQTLIGRGYFDHFPGTEWESIFQGVAREAKPYSMSAIRLAHEDPSAQRYWDCSISPLRGEGSHVDGIVLTLIDATERECRRQEAEEAWRRAHEELDQRVRERTREWEAANRQLEATNRELETFSYSVSHDLRGPLRAINGFTQALAEDCGSAIDEVGRGYIARVRRATMRMSDLIDGLLNLSRVFRTDLLLLEVNLSAIAYENARTLSAGDSRREVTFHIEDNLFVAGDVTLLRVLLQNLFSNAWKFTSKRQDAEITFGKMTRKNQDVFFVRDNGVGFEMAYATQLFTPFHRLHTQEEFDGTGIGLATVRRVIQRHGGEVWAEGSVDGGATFYFTLPRTDAANAELRKFG